jgi:hypothetical protein
LPMASLIHNAMKITSSHTTILPQFFRNSCCFVFNLVGHPITMKVSLMDLAWAYMVGITHAVNSSTLTKWNLLKFWTNMELFTMWQLHAKHPHFNQSIAQHLVPSHLHWITPMC